MKELRSTAPPHSAISTPAAPPMPASRTLSKNSCDMRRIRLTPSASRTAISRRRRSARARSRLATLAHAMSRTISATPLTQVVTLANADSAGPRSVRTDAASARGRSPCRGDIPLVACWAS